MDKKEKEIVLHINEQSEKAKQIMLDEINSCKSDKNSEMFISFLKHYCEKSIEQYKHCLLEKYILK